MYNSSVACMFTMSYLYTKRAVVQLVYKRNCLNFLNIVFSFPGFACLDVFSVPADREDKGTNKFKLKVRVALLNERQEGGRQRHLPNLKVSESKYRSLYSTYVNSMTLIGGKLRYIF